jgi:hypothetical protein
MKTLFQTALILVLLSLPSMTNGQDPRLQLGQLDHLATKANQTVDVNIDERLMQIAAKVFNEKDEDEAKIKKLIIGLKGIYVRSFEFDAENQFTTADVDMLRTQLRGPAWSRLVNVSSKRDGNLEVYVSMAGPDINGLVVLSIEPKELTVVNIVGPVDLQKLAELEGTLGIPDLGIEDTKRKKNEP